eukprot:6214531-Pleurochrysis_carterae.AAC.2
MPAASVEGCALKVEGAPGECARWCTRGRRCCWCTCRRGKLANLNEIGLARSRVDAPLGASGSGVLRACVSERMQGAVQTCACVRAVERASVSARMKHTRASLLRAPEDEDCSWEARDDWKSNQRHSPKNIPHPLCRLLLKLARVRVRLGQRQVEQAHGGPGREQRQCVSPIAHTEVSKPQRAPLGRRGERGGDPA